jgi:hypothetical protein
MRRLIPAVLAAAILAACSDSSTGPEATTAPEQRPSFSVTLPGTNIAITSASCSLVSPIKGDVLCSYSVSNPDGLLMNVLPAAYIDIAYQCQNSGTGKVLSTGVQTRRVAYPHYGITTTTYSATNEALPTAKLATPTNPSSTENPCKGKQIAVATGYSLQYWDLTVYMGSSSPPSACVASDTRYRCTVLRHW